MNDDPEIEPSDPEDSDAWALEQYLAPVPDVVDLVVEAATMESVFAAQRLLRIDVMRRELLADAAGRGLGVTDIVERSIRLELAAAMRVTEYAAGRMIAHAEALVHRYPAALDSLAGGRITPKHAEILIDAVDQLDPALREQVAVRAVALAEAEPVGTFRRALHALTETVQAATLEQRYQKAVQTRRVFVERGHDGMGLLLLPAPLVELHAIHGRATAIAKTIAGHDGDTRTLDQIRADIVCDLLIDGTTGHLPADARGIRATVVVTVPVLALLHDETAKTADPPVVEGIGPIPPSRARELCGGDTGWMRVLTHPETGMVLSVGREAYRPPAVTAQTHQMACRPVHGPRLRDARLPLRGRPQHPLAARRPHLPREQRPVLQEPPHHPPSRRLDHPATRRHRRRHRMDLTHRPHLHRQTRTTRPRLPPHRATGRRIRRTLLTESPVLDQKNLVVSMN